MSLVPTRVRPEELSTCISCGLCLNDCPTFRILGDEADSPRGRIALIRTLVTTTDRPDSSLVGHLEACLVCRACETVCPSGVPFGRLMEGAREVLREREQPRKFERVTMRVGLAILSKPRLLAFAAGIARLYARSGARRLVGRLPLLPRALRRAETLLPFDLPTRYRPADVPAVGVERRHVAFLAGCVMRVAFGDTERATVRVLAENGCRVSVIGDPSCCGALHAHAGEGEAARTLARRLIRAFEATGAPLVITNAAGCGAHLKGYAHLFRDDAEWTERAARFATAVRDATEFLAEALVVEPRPIPPIRVAYQDACHLGHGQGIRRQPRALLRRIVGVTLLELGDGERCCGSAGIYNLTHAEVGAELGRQKVEAILRARPDVVVSANPGCLMQIAAHLRAAGSDIRTAHVIDLLAAAYEKIDA